jgi:hypothetical protein
VKTKVLCSVLVGVLMVLALGSTAESQTGRGRKPQRGAVCPDPNVACRTTATFEAYDMPFRIPANAVIWESEPFYAVILKSVNRNASKRRRSSPTTKSSRPDAASRARSSIPTRRPTQTSWPSTAGAHRPKPPVCSPPSKPQAASPAQTSAACTSASTERKKRDAETRGHGDVGISRRSRDKRNTATRRKED